MMFRELRRTLGVILALAVTVGVVVPVGLSLVAGYPLFASSPTTSAASTGVPSASPIEPTASPIATTDPTARPTSSPTAAPDKTAPVVSAHTPKAGATNIAATSAITITFSEPVARVSGTTILLVNVAGGWNVRATVSYNAATMTATLRPALYMYPRTAYEVQLTNGIRDLAGNALKPTSWTFKTGS